MGNLNSGKRIYNSNNKFFREWNPNMAYLLGFTCADGCVYKGTLSWELSNKFPSDQSLLEEFSRVLNSNYQIEERPKSYRLRINSLFLIKDLEKLGIVPNKTKILNFPKIPNNLLRHFIRGFLDGDGWISMRNERKSNEINIGFSNGSKLFMLSLVEKLKKETSAVNFNLRKRKKLTKSGAVSICYQIDFYSNDAYSILRYLYDNLSETDLFLIRKYEKQKLARNYFNDSQKIINFGKKWFKIEKEKNIDLNLELLRMFNNESLLPREIALKMSVSLSTIYRWFEKKSIRIPSEKVI